MSLIEKLPPFYSNSSEVKIIQDAFEKESNGLKNAIKDIIDQIYVDSATWGLAHWEKYLNLSADGSESLLSRRSRIKTRLRGQGTTTKEMIKNVCSSFVNGEVEVTEIVAEYIFKIKFISNIGIPSNVEYLRKSIEEIKPAHLAFEFIYIYNTNATLKNFTHEQLAAYTHWQLRNEVIV